MQDRPDAHELAAALAQFLFEELRPNVPRQLRFGVLVAANAAAMLAREWEALDPADRHRARAAQAELAADIRAGALDRRWDEAVAVLRDSVRAKLAVAHPGYDAFADDGRG